MISVTPTYKSLLSYLVNHIDLSVWEDLVDFLQYYSDDEIHIFDKLSEIRDSLESFCEESDLPEGFWMNYGGLLDIIKDLFYILFFRLCEQSPKSLFTALQPTEHRK